MARGTPTPTARRTAMGSAFSVCVFTEDPKLHRAKMTVPAASTILPMAPPRVPKTATVEATVSKPTTVETRVTVRTCLVRPIA